ncbi:MAG: T9SS type A sorting domain-containing protein [Dysgonamonadaceae bacterium]|jgi:hypothetical protein|nr:T9SS type A sorting domain-containing protein [Dysgonamonadaceae bacterium]
MKKIICTVMLFAFLANVSAQLNAAFSVSDTITVEYQRKYLAPNNVFSLQFDSLLRDWRSPEGSPVNYDKDVKVRISLTINGQNYQPVLTLLNGGQQYAIAHGLRFKLLAVEPRPSSEVKPSDYKITMVVQDCEDVGQYLIAGQFEEARKVIDDWLKEPKEWVIPANILFPAYELGKLTEWLEYHLAVSDAQILCYECIKTNPTQSEIIISYSNQGVYNYKVLDVRSGLPMQTGGFHDFDGTSLLLLQVDYTTNRFEAVKDLFFTGKSNEFSVTDEFESPGDFGSQRLYYEELHQLFFYGTIVWMGRGEIEYPKIWNIPDEYPLTAQRDIVMPKNGFEIVGAGTWQPSSENLETAWLSVMPLLLSRQFIAANPEEKVKAYFYQPSVGVGNPRDWKWIFILRNQSHPLYNQSLPTAIDNIAHSSSPECKLYQNVPNPFSQNAQIKCYLPESVKAASLTIYNLQGKQLKQIPVTQRGESVIDISGSKFPAGTYLYILIADGKKIDTKRMILTK